MNNPSDNIKDLMWSHLMSGNQKFGDENIEDLKDLVYTLIQAATQKDAGQRKETLIKNFNWEGLDMLFVQIACETTALVLSGRIEELKGGVQG